MNTYNIYSLENINVVGQTSSNNNIVWIIGTNEKGDKIELGLIGYDTVLDVEGNVVDGLELNDIFDHSLIEQDHDQELVNYKCDNGIIVEQSNGEGLAFWASK
tara:strand:+ start:1806 stop:2114 length:309 start_codon:yes stop_codon:yes gene_type:complete